ncbi:hypothetical protein AOLI_G00091950 [Acnodon oligacanthus]
MLGNEDRNGPPVTVATVMLFDKMSEWERLKVRTPEDTASKNEERGWKCRNTALEIKCPLLELKGGMSANRSTKRPSSLTF